MYKLCVAAAIAASVASVASAASPAFGTPASRPLPLVADHWAAAPINDPQLIRRAVKDSIAEEKEIAVAASKAAAIPKRYTASSYPTLSREEMLSAAFDDAKVPGCLQPDGLKRQSTLIFTQLLALPFIPIAYLRGKCN